MAQVCVNGMESKIPALVAAEEAAGLLGRKKPPVVDLVGPWGSAKTIAAIQVAERLGVSLLILTPGRIEAEAVHDDLCTFAGEEASALFPAWEVLPSDTMNPADDIVAERMNTLKRLATAKQAGRPCHLVVPVRAALQQVVSPGRLTGDMLELVVDKEFPVEDLLEKLIRMGYTREVMVENRGEVSVRGGIVDIFPISSELPYRIEFFGDEVESIRRFEPETQRSIETADRMQILPRSEKILLHEEAEAGNLVPITAYFPEDTLVVFDEPAAIRDQARDMASQLAESRYCLPWETVEAQLNAFRRLNASQVGLAAEPGSVRVKAPTRSITGFAGHTDDFWTQLEAWGVAGYTVYLYCINSGERRRLLELIEEHGYRHGANGDNGFAIHVRIGRLRAGFSAESDKIAVLSEKELFGRHYVRRTRRRFEAGAAITQFSDLKSGDYIVHAQHGIGRYLGLRRFEGRSGDYMMLQYGSGDTLYVPVTHVDEVQKYVGGDGAMPKMDKLGGATWAKAKARVKKAVKDMTEELVKLYAAREQSQGHAFQPDTPWQSEFEESFPYEETPDQARAIVEVKRDMEAARPMDRLVCGDVGYGKTEVGLRAAFKAVLDGKQVAILAPTTVLTQQHFNTFSERMADFPVRIELLNRFRTPKQVRETIERLKAGEVDIVVGTHRLVSKDVAFHNLGLVVIDEEQRFGVAHKERLKTLRAQVDVLTLTATPIPRTLHLSLIGVRDMSVINTAPNDRLPIHTCVEVWDKDLIREAVTRELAREGQVFFLHNRVQTIAQVCAMVNELVPKARVAFGHGQMPKHELEEVMLKFVNREVDILVCTTIIGSGIDIANANTIIVDRADTFGLSELYQIRGRVGRYKHRAFAYLLVPGDRALSEEAQLRLKALEDFSSLGAGFRIAMRDLEIRGAGNLLGGEQSGHIASVGYETYRELIAEAVAEHRGETPRRRNLPPFDVTTDAHIPDTYVPTAQQKMTLYRRVAGVQSADEIDELALEIKDRFGPVPGPVQRLLRIMRARALAFEAGLKGLAVEKNALFARFEHAAALSPELMRRLQQRFGSAVSFSLEKGPAIRLDLDDEDPVGAALDLLPEISGD